MTNYYIVFRGDIAPGQNFLEVRTRLKALFRLDEAGINKLFSGRPIALKKNLDEAAAEKWCSRLLKAGAVVERRADESAATTDKSMAAEKTMVVAPVGSDVIEATERRRTSPVRVDTQAYTVDAAGADVLRPQERRVYETLDLDLEHLTVTAIDN